MFKLFFIKDIKTVIMRPNHPVLKLKYFYTSAGNYLLCICGNCWKLFPYCFLTKLAVSTVSTAPISLAPGQTDIDWHTHTHTHIQRTYIVPLHILATMECVQYGLSIGLVHNTGTSTSYSLATFNQYPSDSEHRYIESMSK